jgi:Spy/CpxP family protein refolding chaperone
MLTQEERETVVTELKKIGADLNLSDEQKEKVGRFMTEASEKIQEYKQQNPEASREDLVMKIAENRASIRGRLVNFLTPDQLAKWDAGVAKAKEFLGQKAA